MWATDLLGGCRKLRVEHRLVKSTVEAIGSRDLNRRYVGEYHQRLYSGGEVDGMGAAVEGCEL